ncbi:hypothetical protein DID88_007987 [Monilinia fructigena]|uniref:Xrn1 helical domain-containing protein n=1 Tax=Monilinia fructigena TaxID=38457 RepID=A0A395J403_9HELO|nr:hypothetical protein DID88_007987 [Monilinia fructigena]
MYRISPSSGRLAVFPKLSKLLSDALGAEMKLGGAEWVANKSAAAAIKEMMNGKSADDDNSEPKVDDSSADLPCAWAQYAHPGTPGTPTTPGDDLPPDTVRLWEDGYADRYYEQKFNRDPKDIEFRHQVGRAYVEGLAWVLLYYFQGCPSWDWYYPYHYAPFAADFANLKDMKISFQKGRIFRPFEQLMGVLPAASRQAIPEQFHHLMTNEDSEIIDFYPEDFIVDLNGRNYGGVPLQGDGRGRNQFNYGSGNNNRSNGNRYNGPGTTAPRYNNQSYGSQNNYNNYSQPPPPPGWQPPPPGIGAFARGPPPPPPGSYGGYPPPPPPPPGYGSGQGSNNGYRGNYNNYNNYGGRR